MTFNLKVLVWHIKDLLKTQKIFWDMTGCLLKEKQNSGF
jgi:hypothetical protein